MARFFTNPGAPLTFAVTPVSGGGSSRAPVVKVPTDEERKRQAIRDSVAQATSTTETPQYATSPDSGDFSLNLPSKKTTSVDEDRFSQGMTARGYEDVVLSLKKDKEDILTKQEELKNKQLDTNIKHITTSVQALYAGDTNLAVQLGNVVANPGQEITGFKILDKDNFIEYTKDKPEGTPLNRTEVDKMAVEAKSRIERWSPIKYTTIGNTVIATVFDQTGKPMHVASVTLPNKSESLTPYEKKAQEDAATANTKIQIDNQKISSKAARIDTAISAFTDYIQSGGSTGPEKNIWGTVALASEKAQAADRAFKALNLDEMVGMFQGMSRAVDSDAERAFFEQKQPSMTNKEIVNAQIFAATTGLTTMASAENKAYSDHIYKNQTTDKYFSPYIGKTQVLFSPEGKATIVKNENIEAAQKSGMLTATQMAEKMIKDGTVPKVTMADQAPVVVKTYTTKKGLVEELSDGSLRLKK